MSTCVECSTSSWLVVDRSQALAIKDYEYHLCVKCLNSLRRWTCTPCQHLFLSTTPHTFTKFFPPKCPQCKTNDHVVAELIPTDIRGNIEATQAWRNTLADPTGSDALKGTYQASYLGGHHNAPTTEAVLVGHAADGVRVYGQKTGELRFTISWPSIARIQHVLVPKGKPLNQAEMTVAMYGASGRGGTGADIAAAIGVIGSLLDRDKHLVSIIIRTPDGFEGTVGFESKDGDKLANVLSAERLRIGQQAAPPAQAQASAAGGDVMAKLKDLAGLRDAGIITPQDFDAKKAELLARL